MNGDLIYKIMADQITPKEHPWLMRTLAVLSGVYGWGVSLHKSIYDRGWLAGHRVKRPVISIGNITVGGVGKTPMTAAIGRYLEQQKRKAIILLRGYRSHRLDRLDRKAVNDEVLFLQKQLPGTQVISGRDRVRHARMALENDAADVVVLDDGFQHRRLKRDLDIVAIDATNPFGNGYLIPRGILREPVCALRRADMIVLTKSDLGAANIESIEDVLRKAGVHAPVIHAVHRPHHLEHFPDARRVDLHTVRGHSVCLLSALGDPLSFERLVQAQGAITRHHFRFRDHHWFRQAEIQRIVERCIQQKISYLITTAKDAVRLQPFIHLLPAELTVLVLIISVEFTHERELFFQRIDSVLQR